jgi:hypothetical protein
MSFMRLGYRIPMKVACCALKTKSRVGLIQIIMNSWSLQTLILLK